MGQLKSDGKAVNVSAPAATLIQFGELYRIDGWSGIAMDEILAADTERGLALEVSERVWYIKIPAALAAARGDMLYWSSGAGFKKATTDLVASGTAGAIGPVAKVEEAVDANDYCAVRVLQTAPS